MKQTSSISGTRNTFWHISSTYMLIYQSWFNFIKELFKIMVGIHLVFGNVWICSRQETLTYTFMNYYNQVSLFFSFEDTEKGSNICGTVNSVSNI